MQLGKKNICEVGGGDAEITAYLAKKYHNSDFSVIDFSPLGCELARRRALAENVEITIHQADVFSPPKELLGNFDAVISLGVVEHFANLSDILQAKRRLIRDDGIIFTSIPNFSSPVYAGLCKRWSLTVFEDHVPHSMASFIEGHEKAGLEIVEKGYVSAVEFSMLSMAMSGPEPKSSIDRVVFLWLTRLSKLIHLFEHRFFDLPSSYYFSPFLYAVSKKAA